MFPLLPSEKRVSPKLGFFQEHDKLLFSKKLPYKQTQKQFK